MLIFLRLFFSTFIVLGIIACGGQASEDLDEESKLPPNQGSLSPGNIVVLSGSDVSFGSLEVGQSTTKSIQLKNNGELSAHSINTSSLSSDFQFLDSSYPGTGGTCGTQLEAGAECTIVLSYTPDEVNTDEESFEIYFQNTDGTQSESIQLSGAGILPSPPEITGVNSSASPTNFAEFNWDCNRSCNFRHTININPSHDFGVTAYNTSQTAFHNSGNGTFYFHVQAIDTDFNLESEVLSLSFVMDSIAPTEPTDLSFDLDATESSTSTLYWDEATDANGISHYQFAVGTTSGGIEVSDFMDVVGSNSAVLSGLSISDGIDYFTSIRSVDSAGNVSSPVTSDAWRVPGPPEAINSLAGTSSFKTEITIGWSAPYHNGSAILDYIVEYREAVPADQAWILLAEGVGTDTTAVINALSPSTSYEFRVRAYNGSTSPNSNILTMETAPDDPFFEPDVFQAMNLGGATKSIVVAYEDATEIFIDDVSIGSIDASERLEFDSSLGNIIRSDKEFFVTGRLNLASPGSTDVRRNGNIVWNSPDWAGKEFIFTGTRDQDHVISVYAFEDSAVTINKASTEVASKNMLKGEFHTFSLNSNGGFHLQSSGLLIAYMYSNAGGTNVTDPKPLLPASNDIIGFASTKAMIATATDGTNLNLYHSDSHSHTSNVSTGSERSISSRGDKNLYKGESLRIVGNNLIVANSNADSNGYCSAPFIPTSMLKKKYIINVEADYIAFASLEEGEISMELPDGTISTLSLSRSGLDPLAPLKVRTTNVPAGTKFYSDTRFGAWYQPLGWTDSQSDDDETIMFGFD